MAFAATVRTQSTMARAACAAWLAASAMFAFLEALIAAW